MLLYTKGIKRIIKLFKFYSKRGNVCMRALSKSLSCAGWRDCRSLKLLTRGSPFVPFSFNKCLPSIIHVIVSSFEHHTSSWITCQLPEFIWSHLWLTCVVGKTRTNWGFLLHHQDYLPWSFMKNWHLGTHVWMSVRHSAFEKCSQHFCFFMPC